MTNLHAGFVRYAILSSALLVTAIASGSAAVVITVVIAIAAIFCAFKRGSSENLRSAEQRIALEQHRLEKAINNMPQGLLLFDSSERIVVCNKRYAEMYALSADVVKPGCTFRELLIHRQERGLFAGDIEAYHRNLLQIVAKGDVAKVVTQTTEGRSVQIVNQPLSDGGWVVTHEDITERIRAENLISHMAYHDPLTDLPNRALLRERIAASLSRAQQGETLALLFLDLDRFKNINDTLGHAIGDELLKSIADRLRGCVRDTDTVARLGGDEFVILQTALEHVLDPAQLARRIRAAIAVPFDLCGRRVCTDISIGIAIGPNDGDEPDKLLQHADHALYAAKNSGRGTFCFFEAA